MLEKRHLKFLHTAIIQPEQTCCHLVPNNRCQGPACEALHRDPMRTVFFWDSFNHWNQKKDHLTSTLFHLLCFLGNALYINFWGTSTVVQCCCLYSDATRLQLCTNLKRREFAPCYQWTTSKVWQWRWRKKNRKEKISGEEARCKTVGTVYSKFIKLLFATHFLKVVFPYVFAIAGGWWLNLVKWRLALSVTDECLPEEKNKHLMKISSPRAPQGTSWAGSTLHI